MRKYTPKNDVQNKSYFSDRFYVAPQTPKKDPSSDEIYAKDVNSLKNKFEISESYIEIDELVIYIKNEDNVKVLTFLKEELEYEMLMELSAIDYIADKGGFEIFYEMLSLTKRKRMRVKTFIRQKQPIESVYSVFKMANWAEREMYDMYGVKVVNHPNMKRILMPDDWYDHPLRKTYPLHGDETAQWYEVDKIFGKEARDEIGPEIRDGANVDRYDTERFSRLGHEVPYGTDITDGKEPEHTPLGYQEEGGVRIIKKLHEDDSVTLEERR
ncbi:NADH-quinone oxidoreductase subunit C [Halarcobacter sp.]|uniref:NADH-quinone oxidoreductase subunit C n=1 Tax=Halarcobacter sp. TaxID=2321133 RepID=UPI0029F54136|nr:NADH-quinone oxidoreductase subunit C [Halarcobacter sp.]